MFDEGRVYFCPVVAKRRETVRRNGDSSNLRLGGGLLSENVKDEVQRSVRTVGSVGGILHQCASLRRPLGQSVWHCSKGLSSLKLTELHNASYLLPH